MQTSEALKIIQTLADGVNPVTGEVLADDSLNQNPQIIRALFAAAESLQQNEERQRRKQTLPEHTGTPWETEEEKTLCAGFEADMSINELAQKHKRTRGSIQSRLVKLGKTEATIS